MLSKIKIDKINFTTLWKKKYKMLPNFEYIASHIHEYIEQENLFNIFDETDIKTILKSTKLTPKNYNSLLQQGNDKFSVSKLYKLTQDASVCMNDYQDIVSVLNSMKSYFKIRLLDNILDTLEQINKHNNELLNSVLEQNESNLQKISKLEHEIEHLQNEVKRKDAEISCLNEHKEHKKEILSKISSLKTTNDFESIYKFYNDLCKEGNQKMIKKACDEGLLEKKTKEGGNVLHQASYRGDLSLVKSLIECGVDKNAKNDFGNSPLIIASWRGHLEIVKYLISIGCDKEAKNNKSSTAMIRAAIFGRLDVIQYLVSVGADKEAKTNSSCTPLMKAASNGHLEVVKYLI